MRTNEPDINDLYRVGTLSLPRQIIRLSGENVRVLVEGLTSTDLSNALNSFELDAIEPVETDLETAFIYLAQQTKTAANKLEAVIT